ncbi:MAG TPA: sulfotransferase family protein [Rhodopirellula baltica]|uniref:Uncharacterized protein n=1 Tax=Rhodopirellula baltica (strain DSM 10527 / NCIMB 13988 / SH1) TaxID=243090 RepID=Q7UF04_RHOBA|nr:sulfotransferase domain-containing protein [Rhodopirellula baltica]CAD78879.1 hypothetical protein RB10431 [Rhodopirellula baltica SH 1]HBE64508.1 sulfotransferase family protein [Rhodopirellula baltica]
MSSTTNTKLLVVTGMPRSGTTAVGELLSKAGATQTVYEPFNFHTGLSQIPSYFAIAGQSDFTNESFDSCIDEISSLRPKLKSGCFPEDNILRRLRKRTIGSRTKLSFLNARLRARGLRNLIWKDPFVIFNLTHLAHIPTIVLIRSPEAIAASFKRMNWSFDLNKLSENLAHAGHPLPYPGTGCVPEHNQCPVSNAAILWNIVYSYVISVFDDNRQSHISLFDLQHVVEAPSRNYQLMYKHLGLEWTEEADRTIHELTSKSKKRSSVPSKTKAHVKKRDISQVNKYGRGLLTSSELDAVHSITSDTWIKVQDLLDSRRESRVKS